MKAAFLFRRGESSAADLKRLADNPGLGVHVFSRVHPGPLWEAHVGDPTQAAHAGLPAATCSAT